MKDIILGVDPGTRITGFGLVRQGSSLEVLDFGCIRPDVKMKLSDRLHIIYQGINSIILKHQPTSLTVETQFVQKNIQSAMKLGMVRGIIYICAKNHGLKVYEYAPTKIKLAVTGSGSAEKYQVQTMVKNILSLDCEPEPEDAADALACCICHAHQLFHEEI